MFENLTSRFEGILRNIRGKGRLGPEEVEQVLEEIRVALLEADVHLGVVRTLQDRIRQRAVGEELVGVLNPGQQVVKIVLEELTGVLGGETMPITFASKPPMRGFHRGAPSFSDHRKNRGNSGKHYTRYSIRRWSKSQGRGTRCRDAQRTARWLGPRARGLTLRIFHPIAAALRGFKHATGLRARAAPSRGRVSRWVGD